MTTYVTLSDFKTWADIKSPNHDAQINQLLDTACIVVQDYIGYQLTIDANGDTLTPEKVFKYMFQHPHDCDILLPDFDADISKVELFLKNATASSSVLPEITDANYYVDELAGVLHLNIGISTRLGIAITYTYSNAVDDALKLATYMLIDYWRNKDFQMVKLQGGQSVTSTPTRVLPKHIESIINARRGM